MLWGLVTALDMFKCDWQNAISTNLGNWGTCQHWGRHIAAVKGKGIGGFPAKEHDPHSTSSTHTHTQNALETLHLLKGFVWPVDGPKCDVNCVHVPLHFVNSETWLKLNQTGKIEHVEICRTFTEDSENCTRNQEEMAFGNYVLGWRWVVPVHCGPTARLQWMSVPFWYKHV